MMDGVQNDLELTAQEMCDWANANLERVATLEKCLDKLESIITELQECELDLLKRLDAAEDENERLRAVYEAAQNLYSGGLYPENHEYVLISDRSLDLLDEALAALQETEDGS